MEEESGSDDGGGQSLELYVDAKGNPCEYKRSTRPGGRWEIDEHRRFIEAVRFYNKDWAMIELHVKTRTSPQLRSHAQKFFKKLCKDKYANIEGSDIK